MFYIQLETGRVVADYSKINARLYTNCQALYKLFESSSYARTQAKKYADAIGKTVLVLDLDSVNSWIIRPSK